MDNTVRRQIEEILKKADLEDGAGEKAQSLLRQALKIVIPREDGPWLKLSFRVGVETLKLALGNTQKANTHLPWLLFSLGIAYERNKERKED